MKMSCSSGESETAMGDGYEPVRINGAEILPDESRGSAVGDRNSSAHNREKTDRRSYADHQGAGITGFFCCSAGKLWHKSTSHRFELW